MIFITYFGKWLEPRNFSGLSGWINIVCTGLSKKLGNCRSSIDYLITCVLIYSGHSNQLTTNKLDLSAPPTF